MPETFYREFDTDYLRNGNNPERRTDYRSIFHQDRDRVMFTPAFRRLQSKTQVFQAGEYDFYRTRLTHSLEVSRLAESIAIWLRVARPEMQVDRHLLESVCLAHDIGHPPFGHAGERMLNQLMEPYGGFEGNAQTLRILTCTIYSNPDRRGGMSPSRALLDGILKYKRLYRDRGTESNHFIYDDQAEILEFCFGTSDLLPLVEGGQVNSFRSLECRIMDLADDIAYSSYDIVDGWKARFITSDKLREWQDENDSMLDDIQRKYLDELRQMMADNKVESRMNRIVGELIREISVVPENNFMTSRTNRHAYRPVHEKNAERRIRLHKSLCRDLIFGSGILQQMEHKGTRLLRQLAAVFFDNYLSPSSKPSALVPSDVHRTILQAESVSERARLLCDHLSGMSDAYALRIYKRLLDPEHASISEIS